MIGNKKEDRSPLSFIDRKQLLASHSIGLHHCLSSFLHHALGLLDTDSRLYACLANINWLRVWNHSSVHDHKKFIDIIPK